MKYTIFGKMIDGEETLDAIEKVLIDPKVNFYCFRNRPFFEIPILTDLFEQFFFLCNHISRTSENILSSFIYNRTFL